MVLPPLQLELNVVQLKSMIFKIWTKSILTTHVSIESNIIWLTTTTIILILVLEWCSTKYDI